MNVAFIPVRGGSKSIPLKNIKPICGKPLVYWTIKAACECKYIDRVYVATDSEQIKTTVDGFKAEIDSEIFLKVQTIGRTALSATDTASTEFAMLEFASAYEFDNVVLIQATSPLLQASDLDKGFDSFFTDGVDSVLSAVKQKRFNWEKDERGFVHPSNYDVFNRPRRQEFDGYLVENGAFYIISKDDLIRSKNRLCGNIVAVEMCEDSFFEIDEPSDWLIIESLMKKNTMDKLCNVPKIKMFLTDCDGCLTDGGMYYSENGDELKKFNTRDGMGFSILREKGIITGIITGEDVELNQRRARKLKLDILEADCKNKLQTIKKLCADNNIAIENVCYVGDDLNDLEAIQAVGFGCCPSDANSKVKNVASFITKSRGGEGVVREIVDKIFQC